MILECENLMYWKRNVGEENPQRLLICYDSGLSNESSKKVDLETVVETFKKQFKKLGAKIDGLTKAINQNNN